MTRTLQPTLGTMLYGAVVVTTFVGLLIAGTGAWRVGVGICGGGLIAAAIGRIVIPERSSGLLRVRRRPTDVLILLALGIGLVVLAVVIPNQP
jgi:DUF3017 family protein